MAINHGKIECIMVSDIVDMIKRLEEEIKYQNERIENNPEDRDYYQGRKDSTETFVNFIRHEFNI